MNLSFSRLKPRLKLALLPALFLLFSFACPLSNASSTFNGETYYALKEIAQKLGMKFRWIRRHEEASLKSKWTTLSFKREKRQFSINGNSIWLGHPVRLQKKQLFISKRDYDGTLAPILTPHKFRSPPKLYKIVVDAGHGGKDNGTINAALNLNEKAVALDVAQRLAKLLRGYGYDVHLTRNNDQFIPLEKRTQIANNLDADLFVSIHFNAVEKGQSQVNGIETYALSLANHPSSSGSKLTASDCAGYQGNKNDPWNALLAYHVHTSLNQKLDTSDRGLKRARFKVLKNLKCPGILVEAGFMTHPHEAKQIKAPVHRQKIAQSIATGIFEYQKKLNRIRQKQKG